MGYIVKSSEINRVKQYDTVKGETKVYMIQEQTYEVNNLITRSGKFTVKEFQEKLISMVNQYKDFSIAKGDYIITSTKSIEMIDSEQVMEVEILMPVSYRMPVEDPYKFKNKLKLTNALYTKISDTTKLQETLNLVNQYMLDHELQPITSAYLIQTKVENQPCIEVYVGINPNII